MKIFSKLLLSLLLSASGVSWAGISEGAITQLYVQAPGIAFFKAGTIANTPACDTMNQWAIDLTTGEGKSMLAILLSAQASGVTVYVQGYTNTCRDYSDRELPSLVMMVL